MISRVTAVAYANIALVKYWGKQPGAINAPATPSISLALNSLKTETSIERFDNKHDRFVINGEVADKASSERLTAYLNYWRKNKLTDGHFLVNSRNSFPTKAGLASSSSGFAALTCGLGAFARYKLSITNLSKLARIGSGSAARSIIGGVAALPNSVDPAARLIMPPAEIPWGMVIVEVGDDKKETGSGQGMLYSSRTSPYYKNWVKIAETDYHNMLRAIKKLDFSRIGEIMEANTLAMHACMLTTRPSLLYWTGLTVDILRSVRRWRADGLEVYATIDAGPQVIILANRSDLNNTISRVKKIKGVFSVRKGLPADGAKVVQWS